MSSTRRPVWRRALCIAAWLGWVALCGAARADEPPKSADDAEPPKSADEGRRPPAPPAKPAQTPTAPSTPALGREDREVLKHLEMLSILDMLEALDLFVEVAAPADKGSESPKPSPKSGVQGGGG